MNSRKEINVDATCLSHMTTLYEVICNLSQVR